VSRNRTPITLALLVLLVVFGAWYGWTQINQPISNPFADPPDCVPEQVDGKLTRAQVIVNVYNGSARNDLAASTLRELAQRDFSRGVAENAPGNLRVANVTVLDPEPGSAQVRLVRAQFQGQVQVRKNPDLAEGVDIVLGQGYLGLQGGAPATVRVRGDQEVCVPPRTGPAGRR